MQPVGRACAIRAIAACIPAAALCVPPAMSAVEELAPHMNYAEAAEAAPPAGALAEVEAAACQVRPYVAAWQLPVYARHHCFSSSADGLSVELLCCLHMSQRMSCTAERAPWFAAHPSRAVQISFATSRGVQCTCGTCGTSGPEACVID